MIMPVARRRRGLASCQAVPAAKAPTRSGRCAGPGRLGRAVANMGQYDEGGDPRRGAVAALVVAQLASMRDTAPVRDAVLADADGALRSFLDEMASPAYQVSVFEHASGETQVKGSTTVQFFKDAAHQLVLSKTRPGQLGMADIPRALVVSSLGSRAPLDSLFHAVKHVYGPLLAREAAAGAGVASAASLKLQALLAELEAGLGSVLRRGGGGASESRDAFESPLAGILSVADELQLWADVGAGSAADKAAAAARKTAAALQAIFAEVKDDLLALPSLEDEPALSLMDRDGPLSAALHAAWTTEDDAGAGFAYPQPRMAHLLRLIGESVMDGAQRRLKGLDIWKGPTRKIGARLRLAGRLLASWESTVTGLANEDWAAGSERPWTGEAFRDRQLSALRERLDAILRLREGHEELLSLLGPQEAASLMVETALSAYQQLEPFQAGEFTEPLWAAAHETYSSLLRDAETRVGQKLKERLGAELLPALASAVAAHGERSVQALGHVSQLLAELQGLATLVQRPRVGAALGPELGTLYAELAKFLENLRRDRSERASGGGEGVVDNLAWSKQTEERLRLTEAVVLALGTGTGATGAIGGKPAVSGEALAVQSRVRELHGEVAQFGRDQFGGWQRDRLGRVQDIGLNIKNRLMDFRAKTGHLEVFYSDELVQMLREVRQLAALGFSPPAEIAREAETARKFYRHALVLKQVANFYNSISEQIINCQKEMLLADAEAFERELTSPSRSATWDNPDALEKYIDKLRGVADGLMDKNRRLRKMHEVLADKLAAMLEIDLVRQKEVWGKAVRELHDVFKAAEADGYSRASMSHWMLHWDHQLYKVLEYQYRRGLESLNETLPPMEVKLLFKERRLQYDPPVEKLREAHFKAIKAFLDIPLTHKGVSDKARLEPGFFAGIVAQHGGRSSGLYDTAELIFIRLEDELGKLDPWIALGMLESAEDFVESRLHEVPDWEVNFKMLREAARDADRIPAEFQVDRFKVNMQPVKDAIRAHIRDLQEAMKADLRRKALLEKEALEKFVADSRTTLDSSASSVEDLGKARKEAKQLTANMAQMTQMRARLEAKNRLLKQVSTTAADAAGPVGGGSSVVDTGSLNNDWETVMSKLQQHDMRLEEQKNLLKGKVEKDITDFSSKINGFNSKWSALKPKGSPDGDPTTILVSIDDKMRELEEMKKEADGVRRNCENFGLDPPDFPVLAAVEADLMATKEAWARFGDFSKERSAMADTDWLSFKGRVYELEDFMSKWTDKVRTTPQSDPVKMVIIGEMDRLRRILPLLKFVGGDTFEAAHWAELLGMLGLPATGPNKVDKASLKLSHLLQRADKLSAKADEVKNLAARAAGEANLKSAMDQLETWGVQKKFTLMQQEAPGQAHDLRIIKEWKEVLTEVGDNQALVSSLKDSPYFPRFRDQALKWEERLSMLAESLVTLASIQRKWLYLEPIFRRGALASEAKRFRQLDEKFRQAMADVARDPLVVSFSERTHLKSELPDLEKQLDICQKKLTDFLEEKRAEFPRFYFIGDDDVLEILGQAKNPDVIQAHLKKLFAGINTVVFGEGFTTIKAMLSAEGEKVVLREEVKVNEQVEAWLGVLAGAMKSTLSKLLLECLAKEDVAAFPSQVLSLADQILFTNRCETAIPQNGVPGVLEGVLAKLRQFTDHAAKGQGGPVLQLKVQSLILDLIHARDVADHLVAERVQRVEEWAWARQLRYYKDAPGRGPGVPVVRMAEAEFEYTFEYQGNAPKLVYTPLSDKCYLTLTQGMHLGYGGNPYGPAGTGKTESVKALGQYLGRQVLVFNCDEQFDYRAMGRIFMGLVKCGAWGCFDEFNRLEGEEVLSAVSQQIQVIQAAIKNKDKRLRFMDRDMPVDFNAGIFVTLNPAGKGYGGRSRLPDNLKQLFRSVAMSAPDNELIAEVLLLGEGFSQELAKTVGLKLASVFVLARQLLAPQQHYDWGLRALKTVLGIAGTLLHQAQAAGTAVDAALERQLVLRALRVTTLPKLTFEDAQRFSSLCRDVFGPVAEDDVSDKPLEDAVRAALVEMQLEVVEAQVRKIMQLHMACTQRIGVIIVGPSGSSKSVLWRTLSRAYGLLEKERGIKAPKMHLMNPKAIPRQQLLGHMDLDTREWFDGTLTAASRAVILEPAGQPSWIICDGDVDPEWIESLNSVLDDNRMLTLPNGERIKFGSNVNFIFECHNLKYASPATVSRAGMIFLSDEDINVGVILKAWCAKQKDMTAKLEGWVADYFHRALTWAASKRQAVETTLVGIVSNALSHLEGVSTKSEFFAGLFRGLGANMDTETRAEFLLELGSITGERGLGEVPPIPSFASNASFTQSEQGAAMALIPDVQRNLAMLAPWMESGQPFLLVGPEGCGKSMLLEYAFSSLKSAAVATVTCSAQTSSVHVLQKLVQMCGAPVSTNDGRVLRPRDAERLVLYLKDINLPRPDKYETIQLISFLQQLVTHKGFYDDSLEFIRLERVQIVASMNPATTVGRHPVSTRFTSVVRVGYMTYPPREQLERVYQTILAPVLKPAGGAWAGAPLGKLAATMLDVYDETCRKFSRDERRHYQFTPRNLTDWALGLQRYDLAAVNVVEAVAHEAQRIFRDRLVGAGAGAAFDSILFHALRSGFNYTQAAAAPVFSTFGVPIEDAKAAAASTAPRLAKMEPEEFKSLVQQKLTQYEREFKELDIILFPEVLERIARFDRVLSAPLGAMLLNGRSGVGRRTAANLVAYMHRIEVVSPNITRSYDLKAFRLELKAVMERTGVAGQRVLLFLEDHQLGTPGVLEIVNSLLSGGEVPGLYSNQELELLLGPLKELKNSEGFQHRNLFSFFTARVRQHLRVGLSMDPAHPEYALRCESNPALFSRCSIQWLDTWNAESMRLLPETLLQGAFDMSQEDFDDNVVEQICEVHKTASEQFGATPRQFVAFVRMYDKIFRDKRTQHQEQQTHLRKGLEKLNEAASQVDELSREAETQKGLLAEKQRQAKEALKAITSDKATAQLRQKEVESLQANVAVEEAKANEQKAAVEDQLADVQPTLEAARQAVGQIKSEHMVEIRSLKIPPDPIRDVLEGVLCLMGQGDVSWTNMKRFLGSRTVREDIINFDAHNVQPADRAAVKDLLVRKGSSFEHQNIYRVSVAAAPLAAWVKANVRYSEALEIVGPLERELDAVQARISKIKREVDRYLAEMQELDAKCAALEIEYEQRRTEEDTLRMSLRRATDQLAAAQTLLVKLAGERERWGQQARVLEDDLKALPLNTIMAAAFTVYLPSTPEDLRRKMVGQWVKYLREQVAGGGDGGAGAGAGGGSKVSALARLKARSSRSKISKESWVDAWDFDLRRFMSTESEMLTWKAEGLPSDDLSMENALVIQHGLQAPLIVDPSTMAAKWLEEHLKVATQGRNVIDRIALHDPRFANTLENAVRFGRTLVVTEVDRLEPFMYAVLRKDLTRQGSRLTVLIGDKQIDYDDKFRLYLVTRNPSPTVPPDAASLIALTNFTVTRSGLEAQLLGLTILKEKPQLEAQKSELLQKQEKLKLELAKLEKTLLQTLSASEGNILENKALIKSLEEIKSKSSIVSASLEESVQLAASLDAERNVYRPIAASGALLFFLLRDMRVVNHMYQFSLALFLELFSRSLQQGAAGSDVSVRIAALADTLLRLVVPYVARSLFKDDRITFGMHVARYLKAELFDEAEWTYFLGTFVGDASSPKPSGGSTPAWVREPMAAAYQGLAGSLPRLVQEMGLGADGWAKWAATDRCEGAFPEGAARGGQRTFQQLVVTQAFRPDRLESAMSAFLGYCLKTPISPPPLSLLNVYRAETRASEPVLFILTPGADPSAELMELADKAEGVGRDKYRELAMGQGQAEEAIRLLRECAGKGEWLCLKNLHLVIAWLPTLEKEVYAMGAKADGRFRLFLTSEPHAKFPPTLLEGCLKITVEAPPGVKKNLQRTYEGWDERYVAHGGSAVRAQLLFVLGFFHAVLQERRRYIPQGWGKFYEFSYADLRSGADVIQLATQRSQTMDWNFLRGLLEQAIYGGRVDNPYDARVLRCYLQQYFSPEVLAGRVDFAGVMAPKNLDRGEHVATVAKLPDTDSPAVFGLAANIDRTAQQANSARVISQLRAMAAVTAATSGFDRERWGAQLGPLLRLWDTLLRPIPYAKEVPAASERADARPPVEDFVQLERLHGRRLVARVERSLRLLERVLKGVDMLTPEITSDGQALIAGGLPASWDAVWEGPEEPMAYLRAVAAKVAAVETLHAGMRSKPLLPADGAGRLELDLAHFFHPDTFLNALRQQTARKVGAAMDRLALVSVWNERALDGVPSLPVAVRGLLAQGCVIREAAPTDCEADAPTSSPVPPVVFAWVPCERVAQLAGLHVSVPLYVGLDRAQLLTEVQLPIARELDRTKWVLTGAALFLSS